MARTCGICGLSPRENEEIRPIRLAAGDREIDGEPVGPGLYAACKECVDIHRPIVAKRLGKDPDSVTYKDMQ